MEIDDRGWGRGGGGRGGGGGGSRRCDHFARTGTCKFGDNCRFEHVRSGQGRGGRGGGGRGGDGRNDRVDQSRDAFGGGGAFGRLSGGVFGGSSGGGGGAGGGGGGGGQRQVCRNYSRTGSCRWGDTCRHIHEGAPSSDSSSPFGASAASSPFGAQPASSPFGAASSSPFGAAAPSSPFGAAAASPFGAQPSSPFAAQPQPQPPSGFSDVAHQFVKFFYEAFCSARRSELQVLLRDDSCLTLNDQKLGGRERIMQQFMSLPMDLGNLQIRNLESHPTGPDMSSVLILVMGSVQMSNAQLQINHVFVLMKAQEGQYWISNMIQRWSQ